MYYRIKTIYMSLIFGLLLTIFPQLSYGVQPYEDGFEAIPQGSAQCGPAAFYMIFNYYEDHQIFKEDDCVSEVDLTEELTTVGSSTEIVQWINGGSTGGTSWSQLQNGADGLYQYGSCNPYYVSELEDGFTKYNNRADEQKRRDRLAYIKKFYLDNSRPIIIHLKRYWWLSGHYLVLIGYDESAGIVYYADPSGGTISDMLHEPRPPQRWIRNLHR